MAAVYTPYDGVTRSLSRRPSYHNGPPVGIPYTDPGITYPRTPVMHSEYAPSAGYSGYTQGAVLPAGHRTAMSAYDDRDYEPYYNDRTITSVAPPMMHPSLSTGVRPRRHSSVSYAVPPPAVAPVEPYFRPNGTHIKFKRKSAFSAGISLVEGQSRGMRLSGNEAYSIYELHPERGSILLKVRWTGYPPLTYEIPMETRDGRVILATLARRVSRACTHYLQTNAIPIPLDRVELHHLEEVAYGVWQPMLSTR